MMRISTLNKIGMEGFYLGLKLTIKEVVEDTIMIAEEEDVADEVVKTAPWIKQFLVKVQIYNYNEPPLSHSQSKK